MAAEYEEKQGQGISPAGAMIYAVMIMLAAIMTQIAVVLICMVVYLLIMLAHGGISMSDLSGSGMFRMMKDAAVNLSAFLSFIYSVAVIFWCGFLYYRKQEKGNIRKQITAVFEKGRFPYLVILGFGADIVMTVIVSLIAQAFPAAFEHYIQLMESINLNPDIWTVLYVVLFGPVAEELVFRGVILGKLKQAFPFFAANTLQAVLFGFYHMNLIQGIYAFCFGMILGLVVQVTGTVCASMVVHIIFNGTSEILSFAVDDPGGKNSAFWMIILIAAVFCFISGFRYFWSEYQKRS